MMASALVLGNGKSIRAIGVVGFGNEFKNVDE